MCGIVGELRLAGDAPTADFEQLIALMARRGPDDAGSWSDGVCRLGFRRLSILDLSPAGHQPMTVDPGRADTGRYALVYNGELYNFHALRLQLEARGVQFRSSGDTEVVLQALITWGADALTRFNGMFALGFYDRDTQTLLLARDHAGIKPLYVADTRFGTLFASQYDQILQHPWTRDLPVSADALALYLRLGYIPAPFALLKGSQMLEPGTWLQISVDGRRRHGRFFTFPRFRTPDLSGAAADEALAAAVTHAVRRQKVSDVPLGTFLSGGIDSPLVAAELQAASRHPVKAFTIGSNGSRVDESADAARYAAALGLEHVLRHAGDADALALIHAAVAACGEPFADYSILPTLLVSQLAREQVTVMLSGDGGDELFWGYAGRFGSLLRGTADFQQPVWWRTARRATTRLTGRGNGHANLRWPSLGDWYRAKHTRLPEHWLQRVLVGAPDWPAAFALYDYSGADLNETAQWLRWNEFSGHLGMVLLKVDRASMYHALEVRVPLLDREVIDVATRIDWRSCLDLTTAVGKRPLRAALSRHTRFQTTAKRGFAVPIDDWFRGPLKALFSDLVLSRESLLDVPLDRKGLSDMFTRHQSGAGDFGWALWLLLSLALWQEHHFRFRQRPARVR